MPVLVGTSVWRRYFAGAAGVKRLGDLLDEDGAILVHPFVIGEMVLWGLSAREEELFTRLPAATLVPRHEVLSMIKRRRLVRRGIGRVDAHLIASALASGGKLWSVDAALSTAAGDLGVGYD